VSAPADAVTLIEALEWHAARTPDRRHLTLLEDESVVIGTLTYGQLAEAARKIAAALVTLDVVPGDRVALMLPTGMDFFASFFGALYAGAVPVPIYPPARLAVLEEHMRRQAGILRNAGARVLIAPPEAMRLAAFLRGEVDTLESVETAARLRERSAAVPLPSVTDTNATAFVQYTSGSTGDPKGVVLSHANLLANIRAIGAATEASSADVFVSWLPLYHDLGLIGGWLGCLYYGAQFYVMSPLSFLRRPDSWLWAIHAYRGTLSAAPNFGFELCLNKTDDADIAGLDLGSLRMVANGAEPVSVPTLRRFIARFGRYGFKPEAMAPAFGLAENTVGLTFPALGRAPLVDRVEREALSRRGIAEPARADDANALEIVSCGRALPGHEVRIVDEAGREAAERHEGRLEFRGPSATSGYFRNEAKTRELFRDGGWLDTGDLAYMAAGEVYVTGRIKDIIIRAGRHIYPHEIEQAVGEIPGVLAHGVAAFGITDPVSGTERAVVVAETAETAPAARMALEKRAHEVATDILGVPPDEIVLAPPQTVPKTSSGKIRRSAAKDLYASGRIGEQRPSLRRQLVSLLVEGGVSQLRRFAHTVWSVLYAGWWWTVIAVVVTLAWLVVMVLPRLEWRWAAVRRLARAALALTGIPLSVTGSEYVPAGNAVLVFNHASYADALVLAAVLKGTPAFAAKRELAGQVFAGPFLRRLGVYFVERYAVLDSIADTEAVQRVARAGRLLAFFPEGTFSRRTGLTGFYLGAFKVACETGLPVVPGIVRGARTLLRGEQWFPRWSPVSVAFAEPIPPGGTDFSSVVRLRDAVRAAILARCGEPDLGELAKPEPPPRR
jgi:1-acyl-sn-glycerol-3-phosphate acyltransferase